jgi:hypothetical protein
MTTRQSGHYVEVAEAQTGNLRVVRQYVELLVAPETPPEPETGISGNRSSSWKWSPFKYNSRFITGQIGDRTYAHSQLGIGDSVTVAVVRPLTVTDSLSLVDSDPFQPGVTIRETVNDSLSVSDIGGREVPEEIDETLTLNDTVTVAGGEPNNQYFWTTEATLNGAGVVGQPVYLHADASVSLAQADDIATAEVIGLIAEVNGSTIELLTDGHLTLADWTNVIGSASLSPGAVYYLDESTAGQLNTAPPTTVGEVVVIVGRALSTKTLDIEISEGVLL